MRLFARSRPGRFVVERLSLLDGCVVATGWSEGGPPTLLHKGARVRGATCRTYPRPPLAGDEEGSRPMSFRLAAVLDAPIPDARDLALRFGDAEVPAGRLAAAAEAADPRTRDYPGLFGRFLAAMTGPSRLLEIGSRDRSGNSYRGAFPAHVEHVGLDIAPGAGVDLVADAHHLSRSLEGRFGFVFSISVFEHLLMPWKVALEMNAVMEPGGLAYIQSHTAWPLHEEPWDFFRFSREAWRGLFNAHTGFTLLDAAYSLEGTVVPRHADGGPLFTLDAQPTYLLSACLAQKTGEPTVRWDAEVGEVYDLAYTHG